MSNINKQALREVAKQCSAQEPLRIVEYHGKMCLRNSGGIVFTVLRDSSFPEYSSENENYARLAELSSTATVLALLDELEATEKRIAELERGSKVIKCWSCQKSVTVGLVSAEDGFCPSCNCGIDLDDYETAELVAAGIIAKVGE